MKRLFWILILFGILLLLPSCTGQEYNIMDYQNRDIEAECIINDKFTVALTKNSQGITLTVKEPKEISGVSFQIIGDKIIAIFDETKIEMEKSTLNGIFAIANMFSLEEASLTTAKASGKDSVLSFKTDIGLYQVTIGQNAMPKDVKINGNSYSYNIVVNSISIK